MVDCSCGNNARGKEGEREGERERFLITFNTESTVKVHIRVKHKPSNLR